MSQQGYRQHACGRMCHGGYHTVCMVAGAKVSKRCQQCSIRSAATIQNHFYIGAVCNEMGWARASTGQLGMPECTLDVHMLGGRKDARHH